MHCRWRSQHSARIPRLICPPAFGKRDVFAKLDLAATVIAIRGGRTASYFATVGARRTFWHQQLSVDLETTYIDYRDRCKATDADPTCTGTADGRTIRTGGLVAVHAQPKVAHAR